MWLGHVYTRVDTCVFVCAEVCMCVREWVHMNAHVGRTEDLSERPTTQNPAGDMLRVSAWRDEVVHGEWRRGAPCPVGGAEPHARHGAWLRGPAAQPPAWRRACPRSAPPSPCRSAACVRVRAAGGGAWASESTGQRLRVWHGRHREGDGQQHRPHGVRCLQSGGAGRAGPAQRKCGRSSRVNPCPFPSMRGQVTCCAVGSPC